MHGRIHFALIRLPQIIQLYASEADEIKNAAARDAVESEVEVLELTLIEEPGERSQAKRVISAITSIDLLYDAYTTMHHISNHQLSIIGCDSGSDKKFDFLGITSAIVAIKETIIAIWDRVVFHDARKIRVTLELLTQALPIIEELEAMKGNSLEAEQVEILKRQIISGVSKYFDAGCTIPELEANTVFNPRKLLKPAPKLLSARKAPSDDTDDDYADAIAEGQDLSQDLVDNSAAADQESYDMTDDDDSEIDDDELGDG